MRYHEELFGEAGDQSAARPNQLQYTPSTGALRLLGQSRNRIDPSSSPVSFLGRLRGYLERVDGSSWDSWSKVLVQSVGSVQKGLISETEMWTTFDQWSQGFDGYDEVSNRKAWTRAMRNTKDQDFSWLKDFQEDDPIAMFDVQPIDQPKKASISVENGILSNMISAVDLQKRK